ncbi:MAG TPA: HK97 family phage prohead protease [Streptosporangiaceae bacterium]|nr:HK97 family phage prohead protease [Streptosporangiaceae bacterium]
MARATDEGKGRVTAVFATLGVVDRHGDLTPRGAFGRQVAILGQHNHATHSPGFIPLGKAFVYEDGDQARADLRFNLKVQAARDTYEAIRFDLADPPPLIQYSYGFDTLDHDFAHVDDRRVRVLKRLRVFEVSPVLLGAGIGTRTLYAKDLDVAQAAEWLADPLERELAGLRTEMLAAETPKSAGADDDERALLIEAAALVGLNPHRRKIERKGCPECRT